MGQAKKEIRPIIMRQREYMMIVVQVVNQPPTGTCQIREANMKHATQVPNHTKIFQGKGSMKLTMYFPYSISNLKQ